MGNPPFEDVSPIQNGGFPIAMLVYQRVLKMIISKHTLDLYNPPFSRKHF